MDYKEKYEQALEIAKETYDKQPMYRDWLGKMFPELAESEDEKVRKMLIEQMERWHECAIEDNVVQDIKDSADAITWLEKQGSEPNWCHHKVDLSNCSEEYRKAYYDGWNNCNQQHSQCKSEWNDVVKCLINGMKFYYEDNEEATWGTEKFSMKVKDILSWLEKQKTIDVLDKEEKEFADNVDSYRKDMDEFYKKGYNAGREAEKQYWLEKQGKPFDEEMKTLLRTEYEKGRADAIAEMQKEWSEEDIIHLNNCISYMSRLDSSEMNWLKSLKDRVQPKQEWNEEDKDYYDAIIAKLEVTQEDAALTDNQMNFLKSLRPQNRWKPSDKHIRFLQAMVNDPNNASSESCQIVLKDILEKLKKLKEE